MLQTAQAITQIIQTDRLPFASKRLQLLLYILNTRKKLIIRIVSDQIRDRTFWPTTQITHYIVTNWAYSCQLSNCMLTSPRHRFIFYNSKKKTKNRNKKQNQTNAYAIWRFLSCHQLFADFILPAIRMYGVRCIRTTTLDCWLLYCVRTAVDNR